MIIPITGCESYSKEEQALLGFIEEFYETQYDAYTGLEYIDIEPYLDMDKVQNKNKVTALKKIIIQRKHMEDMKYCYIDKVKHTVDINTVDVNINDNYASVKLIIDLEDNKQYPEFISGGDNSFVLKMVDEGWKIVNHDYKGFNKFEISYKNLLPDIDEEKIKKIIDNEYGESPLSS